MGLQSSRIITFVLIGVLFLSISSVYAETAEEYYNRGSAYGKQGNFTQAISNYTKAVEINPNDAEFYNNRGLAYGKQGNFTQAIFDYTKSIEINPNNADAYCQRGLAYYITKEYDKAWQDVHKAEKLGHKIDPAFLEKLKQCSADTSQPELNNMKIESVNIALDGIFVDANGKYKAMINGSAVSEGSDIGGVKIDKINKDSVDIIVNGQKKNVLVGQGGGSSIKTTEEPQRPSISNGNTNAKVFSRKHYDNAQYNIKLGKDQDAVTLEALDNEREGNKLYPKRIERTIEECEKAIDFYREAEREAQYSIEAEELSQTEYDEMSSLIEGSRKAQSDREEIISGQRYWLDKARGNISK